MKKIMILFLSCFIACFAMACSGGESETKEEPKEKVYLEENQINDLFSNPSEFKGKYVKLKGKIFTAPESDGDKIALQIWYDPVNASNNYIVYTSSGESFSEDEYVFVDGKIDGEFEGENMLGGTVKAPLITDASVEKSSYMDVVVPTVKTVTVGQGQEQHDFKFIIDKIEYAEKETRVYLTLTNDSSNTVGAGIYEAKIIQDGKQVAQDDSSSSSYEGNYPQVEYEILPGASSSGIMVFPAIDPEKDFTFILPDIYSDDYETTFKDFKKEISVKQ